VRDQKKLPLERQIAIVVGAFVRQARAAKLGAERERQQEIQRREEEIQRQKLAELIREEEKKVSNLDTWVTNWLRARHYREFILALEQSWEVAEKNLSPEADHGKRLVWMRQQADRLDPLVESPGSILDRKSEISGHWY
jgi:superfamily II RNA helicase